VYTELKRGDVLTMEDESLEGLESIGCLVASIGTDFLPGCLEALTRAMLFARDAGISMSYQVIRNVCIKPNEGVPFMRNDAITAAMEGDYDYLLMVDNDVLVSDPATIIKLILAGPPLITPWYDCSSLNGMDFPRVARPMYYPNQGILPLHWVSINCLLFHVGILRAIGPYIFPEAIVTNKEEHIFRRLKVAGFKLYQDTSTAVELLRMPTKTWNVVGGVNPNPQTLENASITDNIKDRMNVVVEEWEREQGRDGNAQKMVNVSGAIPTVS